MGLQTVLVVVIVILSILLIAVGVQVFLIILDLRRAVKRLNAILEDSVLGGGLIRPEKLTRVLEIIRKGRNRQTRQQGQV